MGKEPNVKIIPVKTGVQNPVNIFLASKHPGTRETYLFCLDKVAKKLGFVDAWSLNWEMLRYEHVTLISSWLQKNNSSFYAYKVMVAIRGILKTCRSMGLMSTDDYFNVSEGCKVKINEVPRASTGRMLSPEEIQAFLKTCQVGPRNRAIRDSAIFMLMVGCGLFRVRPLLRKTPGAWKREKDPNCILGRSD
jgi:integrase